MLVQPSPYECPPFTQKILDEYVNAMLKYDKETQALRAYVRETKRACDANKALLLSKDPEEQ